MDLVNLSKFLALFLMIYIKNVIIGIIMNPIKDIIDID